MIKLVLEIGLLIRAENPRIDRNRFDGRDLSGWTMTVPVGSRSTGAGSLPLRTAAKLSNRPKRLLLPMPIASFC
jgi:hypothetical protein